jgi:hypothetical protein
MQSACDWNGNKPARFCDRLKLIGGKGSLAAQLCLANTPSALRTLTFWSRGGTLGGYD